MPVLLILIFPLAEIAAFILVGKAIGLFPTLALVVASSTLGAVMLRDAGVVTMLKLERRRTNPAQVLAEGGARMLAGLLLLIPGFLTDIAAFLFLIPGVRNPLIKRFAGTAQTARPKQTTSPDIIEGDFRRLDEPR